MSRPVFLRPSEALRQALDAAGAPGPAVKALLLIGLIQAGCNRDALEADYYQALAGSLAPHVRQALLTAWQSGAHDAVASSVLAECKQVASTAEPNISEPADLWTVGIEV